MLSETEYLGNFSLNLGTFSDCVKKTTYFENESGDTTIIQFNIYAPKIGEIYSEYLYGELTSIVQTTAYKIGAEINSIRNPVTIHAPAKEGILLRNNFYDLQGRLIFSGNVNHINATRTFYLNTSNIVYKNWGLGLLRK